MKKTFILSALLLSVTVFSQSKNDQYSLEAGYGLGLSGKPGIIGLSHFEVGFRYMVDENWGIKFDYGSDRFRTNDTPELGSDYQRFSVQGVHNLGRTLNVKRYSDGFFNLLAHGGLGYSSLKSPSFKGTDKIGNVIIGITPQLKLADALALTLDTSFILNFTQHNNFDGSHPGGKGPKDAFVGNVFTASVGIIFYFGRNGSDSDWR